MTTPMRLDSFDHRRRQGRGLRRALVAVGVLAALAALPVLFNRGSVPEISVEANLPAIGPKTRFRIQVAAPNRGLQRIEFRLRQGQAEKVLDSRSFSPSPSWSVWASKAPPVEFEVVLSRRDLLDVKAKEATVELEATGVSSFLRGAPIARVAKTLALRLQPPRLAVLSENVFVAQGGSEVVVYIEGASSVRSGVQVGDLFFPGYPLPGGEQRARFALFAVPYDVSDSSKVELIAEDEVGNKTALTFIDRFTKKPFSTDTIRVTDGFMEKVVPRILAKTPSLEEKDSLLENYVMINSKLREQNSETLLKLARQTEKRFYWSGAFVQMPAKVVSSFADRRTYLYEGRKVDQQDHLGFDLASVRKDKVPAANKGRVVYSGYLGIYGNTVVLDHGYGLQSLYAHLSSSSVKVGQLVDKGELIGRTGATGLALGDHLHFTMMLHGLAVNPLEWWDPHWIHDRIELKLQDALAAGG